MCTKMNVMKVLKGLKTFKSAVLMGGLLMLAPGCDKMLEFAPGDVILAEDAINDAEDLQRLLNSNYDVLANLLGGRAQAMSELLSGNLARPFSSLDYTAVWYRETNFFTPTTGGVYTDFYYAINRANVVMANFDLVDDLGEADRLRLEAESRFTWCASGPIPTATRPKTATWASP